MSVGLSVKIEFQSRLFLFFPLVLTQLTTKNKRITINIIIRVKIN